MKKIRPFWPWMLLFLLGGAVFMVWQFPTERLVARLLQHDKAPVTVASVTRDGYGYIVLKGVTPKAAPLVTLPTVAIKPRWLKLLTGTFESDVRVEFAGGEIQGPVLYSLRTGNIETGLTLLGLRMSDLPLPDNLILWQAVERLGGVLGGWITTEQTGKKLTDLKIKGNLVVDTLTIVVPGIKDPVQLADIRTGIHLTAGVLQIDVNGGNDLRISQKVYLNPDMPLQSRIDGAVTLGLDFLPPSWHKGFTLQGTLANPRIEP